MFPTHQILEHLSRSWNNSIDAFSDDAIDVAKILVFYIAARFFVNVLAPKIAAPIINHQSRWITGDRGHRLRTLVGLITSVSNYVLGFVFGVMLLRALNVDAVSVVSTAGFAGLAFGFGAQRLVKDVINGFFLIMENQYDVGDYVTVNSITGKVEEIGMRIMKIRDDAGRLFILSNGDIGQVCNMSRGSLTGTLEIGIASAEDVTVANGIVDKAGIELFESRPDLDLTEAPTAKGIGSADSTHVMLLIPIKVNRADKLAPAQIAMRGLVRDRLHDGGIYVA